MIICWYANKSVLEHVRIFRTKSAKKTSNKSIPSIPYGEFEYVLNICYSLSEGFALTGFVVPGCVEDGAWVLWENYSVVVPAVVLARSCLDDVSKSSSFWVSSVFLLLGTCVLKSVVFSNMSFCQRPYPRCLVLSSFEKATCCTTQTIMRCKKKQSDVYWSFELSHTHTEQKYPKGLECV